MKEIVLLVEPVGANQNGKVRPVELAHPVNAIMERCHVDLKDPSKQIVRTWICKNNERALTGERIFREDVQPVKEEAEKPIYDELVLKQPLRFGVDRQVFGRLAKKYGKR